MKMKIMIMKETSEKNPLDCSNFALKDLIGSIGM